MSQRIPQGKSSIEELMFALYQTQKQMLEILQERLRPDPEPDKPEDLPDDATFEDNDFAAPVATRASGRKIALCQEPRYGDPRVAG